ncbi:MAG: outer membrane beta-barrel protein [Alphaproteobacteria bacterium]
MKKLQFLVAVAAIFVTCTATANSSMNGVYGKVQGSVYDLTTHETTVTNNGASGSIGNVGSVGFLFGGYGRMVRDWYMAVQLQNDLNNFDRKFLSTAYTTQLRAQSILGASSLLGYQVIKDMVAYVAAGVDYARWQYSDSTVGSNTSDRLGFAPRFGIRTMISKNIFLNAEYKHTFFRTITISGGGSTFNARPRVQTFTVGLAIKTS